MFGSLGSGIAVLVQHGSDKSGEHLLGVADLTVALGGGGGGGVGAEPAL